MTEGLPSAPADSARLTGAVAKALSCAAFVLFAVALEAISGQSANSKNPGWVYGLVPLTWSTPARVGWWLLVGAAAGGHRYYLVRAGLASGRWLVGVLAAPFVGFAISIAAGASWSTWH